MIPAAATALFLCMFMHSASLDEQSRTYWQHCSAPPSSVQVAGCKRAPREWWEQADRKQWRWSYVRDKTWCVKAI